MNERDIELAKQAGFDSFDIELFQSIVNLADLIRADERACIKKEMEGVLEELDQLPQTVTIKFATLVIRQNAKQFFEIIDARDNT